MSRVDVREKFCGEIKKFWANKKILDFDGKVLVFYS